MALPNLGLYIKIHKNTHNDAWDKKRGCKMRWQMDSFFYESFETNKKGSEETHRKYVRMHSPISLDFVFVQKWSKVSFKMFK